MQRRVGVGGVEGRSRERRAPQTHLNGACSSCQHHSLIALDRSPGATDQALGALAPAVDRVFKTANHRKSHSGHAGGQVIDQGPSLLRHAQQGRADAFARLAALVAPVARGELAQAVEHSASRPQTERGADAVAAEHTKDVAVRRQHRMLDHMAHDFTARQLPHIDLLPSGQGRAGLVLVAHVQRVAYGGEVVAELPKPHRQVKQTHIPKIGQHRMQVPQQMVQCQGQQGRSRHRSGPSQITVQGAACVQVAADHAHPSAQTRVQHIGRAQRPDLLEHQGQQNSKKAHGCDDIAGTMPGLS